MNADNKEQYFYIRNKRCKVIANDQCITIQSELTPNLQTVINFSDLIAIRSCTCTKTPIKLVCKCIQAKVDSDQSEFINPTLTKNIINGNFEKPISFVHADGAFDSNGQFQLRRVYSVESNVDLDEVSNEEVKKHEINEVKNFMNENENCMDMYTNKESDFEIQDAFMNEDEGVEDDSNQLKDTCALNKSFEQKEQIDQELITELLVNVSNEVDSIDGQDQSKVTKIPILKNSNKISMSLESDELSCSLDDDDCPMDHKHADQSFKKQTQTTKRRVSILKDYAQSTLMTSTSSGISSSSCNSTLNKSTTGQPKVLIRCLRIYYSAPYASFNFKIKCINLVPEYLQDNIVITPETIYSSNNEQQTKYLIKNLNGNLEINSSTKDSINGKSQINDSLNTLNSLTTDTDQQRINMVSLMNATSQNRILEQKKIKQFIAFVNDHLQEFDRPKSLLHFINPVGGKKRGPIIYKKVCQPLMAISSIKVHTIYTQKANHAYQLLRDENVDLTYYTALGCVGGDGMYSELLNGMLKRNRSNHQSTVMYDSVTNNGDELNSIERTKRSTSSSIRSKQKQSESSGNLNDDQSKREGVEQRMSERESYKSQITNQQRNAIEKLVQLTNNNGPSRSGRRSKLGVRYSLPNDRTSEIDQNELNMMKYGKHGKRYSLPVSPFRVKSVDLGSRHNLPILVVPSGSTDAVAYSTNGINDPETVMINFLLDKQINVDVAAVHTADEDNRLLKYCSSFLGYGYFADVLKDSEENLRWMGPKRYDWAGIKKFFLHKVYKGELLLKVSLLDGDPKDNNLCLANCQLCAKSYIRNLFNQTGAETNSLRKNSTTSTSDNVKSEIQKTIGDENNHMNVIENCCDEDDGLIIKNINNKNTINIDRKMSIEDENTSMICIKGRFLAINAATITCRCGHSKYGISPSNHTGNGCCDLIIVIAQCTRKDFLKYLIRTGFSEKSAFDLDFVNVYRVKEFTFKPIVDSNKTQPNVWNCDGEILNEAAINVKMHCQMVSVFGNGLEIRASNKTFMKREKLQNTFKLKWKAMNSSSVDSNDSDKNCNFKRYKTSSLKSNGSERRPSKVEFKAEPSLVS